MKKLDTILWTLFTLTGFSLSIFLIMGDKIKIACCGIIYLIICASLQYIDAKERRENSWRYIRR